MLGQRGQRGGVGRVRRCGGGGEAQRGHAFAFRDLLRIGAGAGDQLGVQRGGRAAGGADGRHVFVHRAGQRGAGFRALGGGGLVVGRLQAAQPGGDALHLIGRQGHAARRAFDGGQQRGQVVPRFVGQQTAFAFGALHGGGAGVVGGQRADHVAAEAVAQRAQVARGPGDGAGGIGQRIGRQGRHAEAGIGRCGRDDLRRSDGAGAAGGVGAAAALEAEQRGEQGRVDAGVGRGLLHNGLPAGGQARGQPIRRGDRAAGGGIPRGPVRAGAGRCAPTLEVVDPFAPSTCGAPCADGQRFAPGAAQLAGQARHAVQAQGACAGRIGRIVPAAEAEGFLRTQRDQLRQRLVFLHGIGAGGGGVAQRGAGGLLDAGDAGGKCLGPGGHGLVGHGAALRGADGVVRRQGQHIEAGGEARGQRGRQGLGGRVAEAGGGGAETLGVGRVLFGQPGQLGASHYLQPALAGIGGGAIEGGA